MKIDGYECRFIHIPDPPFEYGFGLDDPDCEYWITPQYLSRPTRVWKRSLLPVEDGKPVFPWIKVSREDFPGLFEFGDKLAKWGEEE